MTKTVFFGPFIGEFGWEYTYWQGWVRLLCKEYFRNCRKIACSFPGRQPFYPYVDEFWPLPETFLALKTSGHGYITDGWRDGLPGIQHDLKQVESPTTGALEWTCREEHLQMPSIEVIAEEMLSQFKNHLPADTRYFVPWRGVEFPEQNLQFGSRIPPTGQLTRGRFTAQPVPFSMQLLEPLRASSEALGAIRAMLPPKKVSVCIFPRCRQVRRPDKNWGKENYVTLVHRLQNLWPDALFILCGEPGGAYFAEGVPSGCLDLINVPPAQRLDLHFAALQCSLMAIGGLSGALCVAAGVGTPCVVFCPDYGIEGFRAHNILKTPMVVYPEINPSVDTVVGLAHGLRDLVRDLPARP